MLDERLALACQLYGSCTLGADIGTDHGLLPVALLKADRCAKMILTDISPSALDHARQEIFRQHLEDRVSLRCGNGLEPLDEPCDVISVMGMGGRTISDILLRGSSRLHHAALILSAHTDLPLLREAVQAIGYHLDREEPCFCGGRFYLVIRAFPGAFQMTPQMIRLGGPLFSSQSPRLIPYLTHRRNILTVQRNGLLSASVRDGLLLDQLSEDIDCYNRFLEEHRNAGKGYSGDH